MLRLRSVVSLRQSFCCTTLSYDSKQRLQVSWRDDRDRNVSYFIDYLGSRFLNEDPHISRSSPLCIAMGKKNKLEGRQNSPWVYDLTGGIGRDSVRLLNCGYRVIIHERNSVLVKLIQDALIRLHNARPELIAKITLCPVDSTLYYDPTADSTLTTSLVECGSMNFCPLPTIVYLDPMYESVAVGRKSKVKKDTQLLHTLTQPNPSASTADNEAATETGVFNNSRLFETARRLCRQRVVVKRSNKDPPLLGAIPHESIKGKTHRYDVYFKHRDVKQSS